MMLPRAEVLGRCLRCASGFRGSVSSKVDRWMYLDSTLIPASARWRFMKRSIGSVERCSELGTPSGVRIPCRRASHNCKVILRQGFSQWRDAEITLHHESSCLQQNAVPVMNRRCPCAALLRRRDILLTTKCFYAASSSERQSCQKSFVCHSICIVGSGPSGFYCAKALLQQWKQLQDVKQLNHQQGGSRELTTDTDLRDIRLNIVLIDALPSPYGLSRYGVAPDHPEVKAVINIFDEVASSSNVFFRGNVKLGQDVDIDELRSLFHVVVLAIGASGEKTISIEGSKMRGVCTARQLALWYNTHPRMGFMKKELSKVMGSKAVIVGNGNVALDVARILCKAVSGSPLKSQTKREALGSFMNLNTSRNALNGRDDSVSRGRDRSLVTNSGGTARFPVPLHRTDINEDAFWWARERKFKFIRVVGRRGAVQASFTNKELRGLLKEKGLLAVVDPEDIKRSLNAASLEELQAGHILKSLQGSSVDVAFARYASEGFSATTKIAFHPDNSAYLSLCECVQRDRVKQRSLKLLYEMAENWNSRHTAEVPVVQLSFCLSPEKLLPDPANPGSVGSILLRRNTLVGNAGSQRAVPLYGKSENLLDNESPSLEVTSEIQEAALVVWSVGFEVRLAPVLQKTSHACNVTSRKAHSSESSSLELFDGFFKHSRGRVVSPRLIDCAYEDEEGRRGPAIMGGVYVCGWCKHGPKGTIAEAVLDAKETASQIMQDIRSLHPLDSYHNSTLTPKHMDTSGQRLQEGKKVPSEKLQPVPLSMLPTEACTHLDALLRSRRVRFVTFDQWVRVAELERQAGEREGRSARKFESEAELLKMAGV